MGKSLLVDGNIPAGQACPFADNCGLRFARCPTTGHLKEVPFSCAAARLHDMMRRDATPEEKHEAVESEFRHG